MKLFAAVMSSDIAKSIEEETIPYKDSMVGSST